MAPGVNKSQCLEGLGAQQPWQNPWGTFLWEVQGVWGYLQTQGGSSAGQRWPRGWMGRGHGVCGEQYPQGSSGPHLPIHLRSLLHSPAAPSTPFPSPPSLCSKYLTPTSSSTAQPILLVLSHKPFLIHSHSHSHSFHSRCVSPKPWSLWLTRGATSREPRLLCSPGAPHLRYQQGHEGGLTLLQLLQCSLGSPVRKVESQEGGSSPA